MRQGRAGLAIVGAVIGAGFASGREVMQFFTRFGAWGAVGIAAAALSMGAIAWRVMHIAADCEADCFLSLCRGLLGRIGGVFGALLYGALLAATGGAMLSGAGELYAIAIPIHSAYALGFCATLALGFLVAVRGLSGVAACSSAMVPLCVTLYGLLILQPSSAQGVQFAPAAAPSWQALPLALSYAALNMALIAGLLCEAGAELNTAQRKGAAGFAVICLGALLLLAHAALLPNAAVLRDAPLPMVAAAARLGLVGFWLCVSILAIAMLSTLSVAVRGLFLLLPARWGRPRWTVAAALCAFPGMVGFERLIGAVYPVLGWGAAALILALCCNRSASRR